MSTIKEKDSDFFWFIEEEMVITPMKKEYTKEKREQLVRDFVENYVDGLDQVQLSYIKN